MTDRGSPSWESEHPNTSSPKGSPRETFSPLPPVSRNGRKPWLRCSLHCRLTPPRIFRALVSSTRGDIKNNTIRSKDIRNGTVGSGDVRNSALLAEDFKAGELPAGPRGPQGLPGASGATGATGAMGPPGPVKLVYRKGTANNVAPGVTGGFSVGCPEPTSNVVGGGFNVDPATENFRVVISRPTDGGDPDGIPDDNWEVLVRNAGAAPVSVTTYAICTTATAVEQAPDEL